MQLFNLIGRLTDEMRRLETDCVDMKSEITRLKNLPANQEINKCCEHCVGSKIPSISIELTHVSEYLPDF